MNDEILDSIDEGLITVDKDFRITFFNKAAEEITGFKKEEVSGKICEHIFKCDQCAQECPMGLILETGKGIYEFRSNIEVKDGSRKKIVLNASILRNEKGEPTGGVIAFRDLSEIYEIRKDKKHLASYHGIIGRSKAMQEIFQLIKEISASDATVLIQGESGTGKEMVANSIQETSSRKNKAFVKVNCSVFPENLLASELFGHVKGAFTDAIQDRAGRFELANGGTIFLDEIAEMPLQTQVQLLRILQEGTFERVGESITRRTDVRVIAATNVDVNEALKQGKLREDLYYRLNVIPIVVPPLRKRKEDIPHLINHFIHDYSKLYKKETEDISDRALDLLMKYSWPGNVRELENVIEFAIVRSRNNIITIENLPPSIKDSEGTEDIKNTAFRKSDVTRILKLLEKYKWNKTKVAEELGIGRTTLWRILKRIPIEE